MRTKRAFKVKRKAFLSFLKGFQLPKIILDLGNKLGTKNIQEISRKTQTTEYVLNGAAMSFN